ncbi:hypothetical protein EZV62_025620 [Acer yangbiense]|uniref:Phorbol-ester/DAG-type domain-containing protein n=1 Tax=Acer yangbiense TaxID=1000413 RepID=A0A5C7GZ20_9ROSI|nr:hypothetical protein EZV62_025620 [Acer yangbiense]
MMEVIRHDSHPHELELKSYNKSYTCDGCKEFGFGSRFRCEQCNFDIHKECVHADQITRHDFFKNTTFKFFPKPPGRHERYCNACGGDVGGFVYHCEEGGWDLHPCCHSLPSKFKFDYVEFRLHSKVLPMCLWCDKSLPKESPLSALLGPGWSYVSKCNKYNFHVSCATRMMLQQYEKGIQLGNSLEQSIQVLLEISIGSILKRQRRRKIVMSFVITNLVLELISAVLDQVSSSVNKIQCGLFGMLISCVAMLTCIVELIYEVQTEKLIWQWISPLPFPWYYYQDQGRKPFGTFKDIVGLICAFCQCVIACISYCYIQRHIDNPIKISIFPIIFAFGILFSQILKNQDVERSSRENQMHSV